MENKYQSTALNRINKQMSIKSKFITTLAAHVPLNENETKAAGFNFVFHHRRRLGDNHLVVGEITIVLLQVELTF